jgi:hypothetical protein
VSWCAEQTGQAQIQQSHEPAICLVQITDECSKHGPLGSGRFNRGCSLSHRCRLAIRDGPVIDIPAGACLEIVRLDERWDNTHAMIVRTYKISLDLRVLTGVVGR